jgi:SPW repeat-containing protein
MSNAVQTFKGNWRDVANLILGVWLFVLPWVLADVAVPAAIWNAHVMGIIIVVAAVSALVAFHEWEEWVSVAFGVWLIIAPWVLGFAVTGTVVWSGIVVGMLVGLMAIWSIYDIHEKKAHA